MRSPFFFFMSPTHFRLFVWPMWWHVVRTVWSAGIEETNRNNATNIKAKRHAVDSSSKKKRVDSSSKQKASGKKNTLNSLAPRITDLPPNTAYSHTSPSRHEYVISRSFARQVLGSYRRKDYWGKRIVCLPDPVLPKIIKDGDVVGWWTYSSYQQRLTEILQKIEKFENNRRKLGRINDDPESASTTLKSQQIRSPTHDKKSESQGGKVESGNNTSGEFEALLQELIDHFPYHRHGLTTLGTELIMRPGMVSQPIEISDLGALYCERTFHPATQPSPYKLDTIQGHDMSVKLGLHYSQRLLISKSKFWLNQSLASKLPHDWCMYLVKHASVPGIVNQNLDWEDQFIGADGDLVKALSHFLDRPSETDWWKARLSKKLKREFEEVVRREVRREVLVLEEEESLKSGELKRDEFLDAVKREFHADDDLSDDGIIITPLKRLKEKLVASPKLYKPFAAEMVSKIVKKKGLLEGTTPFVTFDKSSCFPTLMKVAYYRTTNLKPILQQFIWSHVKANSNLLYIPRRYLPPNMDNNMDNKILVKAPPGFSKLNFLYKHNFLGDRFLQEKDSRAGEDYGVVAHHHQEEKRPLKKLKLGFFLRQGHSSSVFGSFGHTFFRLPESLFKVTILYTEEGGMINLKRRPSFGNNDLVLKGLPPHIGRMRSRQEWETFLNTKWNDFVMNNDFLDKVFTLREIGLEEYRNQQYGNQQYGNDYIKNNKSSNNNTLVRKSQLESSYNEILDELKPTTYGGGYTERSKVLASIRFIDLLRFAGKDLDTILDSILKDNILKGTSILKTKKKKESIKTRLSNADITKSVVLNNLIQESEKATSSSVLISNLIDNFIEEFFSLGISEAMEWNRKEILKRNFDILIYPEFYMDTSLHYLGMSKLAKIQISPNGHPITSGLPREIMDYHIGWEASEANNNYFEEFYEWKNRKKLWKSFDSQVSFRISLPEIHPAQTQYTEKIYLLPEFSMYRWYEPRTKNQISIYSQEEEGSIYLKEGEGSSYSSSSRYNLEGEGSGYNLGGEGSSYSSYNLGGGVEKKKEFNPPSGLPKKKEFNPRYFGRLRYSNRQSIDFLDNLIKSKLLEYKRWYFCPQALFKLHSSFDSIILEILRRDLNSVIILPKAENTLQELQWMYTNRIKDTLNILIENNDNTNNIKNTDKNIDNIKNTDKNIDNIKNTDKNIDNIKNTDKNIDNIKNTNSINNTDDRLERIIFTPRLSHVHMMVMHRLSDVVLDSVWFGGDTTTREALETGIPIVTLPHQTRLGGRWTFGFLKNIHHDEPNREFTTLGNNQTTLPINQTTTLGINQTELTIADLTIATSMEDYVRKVIYLGKGIRKREKRRLRKRIIQMANEKIYRQEESIYWWTKALYDIAGRGEEMLVFKNMKHFRYWKNKQMNKQMKESEEEEFVAKDEFFGKDDEPVLHSVQITPPSISEHLIPKPYKLLEKHISILRKFKNDYYKLGIKNEPLPPGVINGGERKDIPISYANLIKHNMNFEEAMIQPDLLNHDVKQRFNIET